MNKERVLEWLKKQHELSCRTASYLQWLIDHIEDVHVKLIPIADNPNQDPEEPYFDEKKEWEKEIQRRLEWYEDIMKEWVTEEQLKKDLVKYESILRR